MRGSTFLFVLLNHFILRGFVLTCRFRKCLAALLYTLVFREDLMSVARITGMAMCQQNRAILEKVRKLAAIWSCSLNCICNSAAFQMCACTHLSDRSFSVGIPISWKPLEIPWLSSVTSLAFVQEKGKEFQCIHVIPAEKCNHSRPKLPALLL